MMKPINNLLCVLFFFNSAFLNGQVTKYHFKRAIQGNSEQWHKIELPNDIFGKIAPDFSDIRILGITATNDTIEAPYLIEIASEKIDNQLIAFNTINTSFNEKGFFITFEIPSIETINQISLDFKESNFDWLIKLEGSQNQRDWFTIIDKYRILSIKNESTDFQFTKLSFPNATYHFFRLQIETKEKPHLLLANVSQQKISAATYQNYHIKNFDLKENKKTKQTEIDIVFKEAVPVSFLKLNAKNSFDYYRPISIQNAIDSIKTTNGWIYNYEILASGTLNSIEKNEFKFKSTIARKLKIIIENHDNQPLTINSVQAKGYKHELVTRLTEKASYFLIYGNDNALPPKYDLAQFAFKIPIKIDELTLGKEQMMPNKKTPIPSPLFKNKTWLWIVMIIIIGLLGWFSIKMIQKK